MTSPFAARQKPAPGPSTRTPRPGAGPTGDPVTDKAYDPAPVEHAHDLQAPIGGTSAAVPASASAPAPASVETPASAPADDQRSTTGGAPSGSAMPDPASEPTSEVPPHARLDDLKKGELAELARRHKIEVVDADTRATLIGKLDRAAGRSS